jgi:hypothetical protein
MLHPSSVPKMCCGGTELQRGDGKAGVVCLSGATLGNCRLFGLQRH